LKPERDRYMEKWEEVYKGSVPDEEYRVLVQNGEEFGLSIKLEGSKHTVDIFFGAGASVRMLEEGVISPDLFKGDDFINYKNDKFSNIIYKVDNGKFGNLAKIASEDLYEFLEIKHYVVITMNYVIDIITEWEPEIEVKEKYL